VKSFKHVAIIGTGLIGGSIGLALREKNVFRAGFDRPKVLKKALKSGAVDKAAESLEEAVCSSDLIVLATPVRAILELLPQVAALSPSSAVITDVGGSKREICGVAERNRIGNFIGGHPLAGKERCGIGNAEERLFVRKNWFLCPGKSPSALAGMKNFVETLGAFAVITDPEKHDRILAVTSHLPQLVSTLLAATVEELMAKEIYETDTYAGTGLKDCVRLAASPFSIWKDVLASNKDEVRQALQKFTLRTNRAFARFSQLEELNGTFKKGNRLAKRLR
jgi:prephenate dehydrogenase